MRRNGSIACTGIGANVLGSPCTALTWIANELSTYGPGLLAGEIVTTGTCIAPLDISPGDHLMADFGDFGCVDVVLDVHFTNTLPVQSRGDRPVAPTARSVHAHHTLAQDLRNGHLVWQEVHRSPGVSTLLPTPAVYYLLTLQKTS